MKALAIIDMQRGSFKPETPRHDANGVIERINKLSGLFRSHNDKVIFIQHNGLKQNNFIPGTSDWEILPTLTISKDDVIISKTANDSFYKTDLEKVLSENDINELIITGCATDFCVDTTIKSALTKEFDITIVKDGHTNANRPGIDAETLINYYNMIWGYLIPVKNNIKVISCEDLLKELE